MTTTLERTTVFDRVLVGLDGSAESREAARLQLRRPLIGAAIPC